jgi:hypothetical protein
MMTLDSIVLRMLQACPANAQLTQSIRVVSNGAPDGLILDAD